MGSALRLIRTVSFRAVHRLALPGADAEANRRRFGWTAEPHHHDYRCTVTVAASLPDHEAMVIDLAALDSLLAEEVVDRFDGRRLDRDVSELASVPTTCEAIARLVFQRLAPRVPPPARLVSVRVAEDEGLAAEIVADGG